MLKTLLGGVWNLKIMGKDAGLTGEEGIEAKVPGTVYGALLEKGLIEDPFTVTMN